MPKKQKSVLYKTRICDNWQLSGSCRYGDECQFAHGIDELRMSPDLSSQSSRFGKLFSQHGSCKYGSSCRFRHLDPSGHEVEKTMASVFRQRQELQPQAEPPQSWTPRQVAPPQPLPSDPLSRQGLPHILDYGPMQSADGRGDASGDVPVTDMMEMKIADPSPPPAEEGIAWPDRRSETQMRPSVGDAIMTRFQNERKSQQKSKIEEMCSQRDSGDSAYSGSSSSAGGITGGNAIMASLERERPPSTEMSEEEKSSEIFGTSPHQSQDDSMPQQFSRSNRSANPFLDLGDSAHIFHPFHERRPASHEDRAPRFAPPPDDDEGKSPKTP